MPTDPQSQRAAAFPLIAASLPNLAGAVSSKSNALFGAFEGSSVSDFCFYVQILLRRVTIKNPPCLSGDLVEKTDNNGLPICHGWELLSLTSYCPEFKLLSDKAGARIKDCALSWSM